MDSLFWSYVQALKQVAAKRKEKPESSWQRQHQSGSEATGNLHEERQRAEEKYDLLECSGKHMGQVRTTCFPEEVLIWLVNYLQWE